ncbi:MAG: hypothetical protein IKD64_05525 [Lachnospiraceae bacterium]|nr:hypothetical protein [Lachnospiraceae bacterium]
MKKFLTVFLIITMIFSLAACGLKTGNKWEYSREDLASFNEVFSEKALDQEKTSNRYRKNRNNNRA